MEIKGTLHTMNKVVPYCVYWLAWLVFAITEANAQPTTKSYFVKDNRMYVAIGKDLSDASIDSFARQFNLTDLALKKYIRGVLLDSLKLLGWKVDVNSADVFIISKSLSSLDNIDSPVGRMKISEREHLTGRFPVVSNTIRYGYNRFRKVAPFTVKDSVVTFVLRDFINAKRVMLAGSFNDWNPDILAMKKTDTGWAVDVKLRPGKYWYKFIADGKWMPDPANQVNENDGLGNINSVFFVSNKVIRLNGYTNAKRVYVSGSFNDWDPDGLLMNKTEDGWEIPLYLADGTHTYRFVADRRWFADPDNPTRYPNEYGEYNSVIRIGKPFVFFLPGQLQAQKVVLTGSFNGWRPDELYMTKTEKGWELSYTLGPGNYEYNFIIDNRRAEASGDGLTPKGSGNFYFVIQPNYTFRLKGHGNAKAVYLSGDFNNWSPNTFLMKKEGDEWVLDTHLSIGKHLYKFVVDGKWIIDPGNKLWEQNEHHTGNSVIWIED